MAQSMLNGAHLSRTNSSFWFTTLSTQWRTPDKRWGAQHTDSMVRDLWYCNTSHKTTCIRKKKLQVAIVRFSLTPYRVFMSIFACCQNKSSYLFFWKGWLLTRILLIFKSDRLFKAILFLVDTTSHIEWEQWHFATYTPLSKTIKYGLLIKTEDSDFYF